MGRSFPDTNLNRWRLDSEKGAYRWLYLSEEDATQRPQTPAEKHFLGLSTVELSHGQGAAEYGILTAA